MNKFDYIYNKFTKDFNVLLIITYIVSAIVLTFWLSPLYFEKTFSYDLAAQLGAVVLFILVVEFLIFSIQYNNYKRRTTVEDRNRSRNTMLYSQFSRDITHRVQRPTARIDNVGLDYLSSPAGVDYHAILDSARTIREVNTAHNRTMRDTHDRIRHEMLRQRLRDRNVRHNSQNVIIRRQIESMRNNYKIEDERILKFVMPDEPIDPIINSIDDLYDE